MSDPTLFHVHRYPDYFACSTPLDPLCDALTWVTFLKSIDYVSQKLVDRHGLTEKAAGKRAAQIVSHARFAIEYFEQSLASRVEVSFLPAYYGMLNLAKISVLTGQHHSELANQRLHGATYSGIHKASRSVAADEIKLMPNGTLSLFYQTLFGHSWPNNRVVRMGELYPYLVDVAAEYNIATGKPARIASFTLRPEVVPIVTAQPAGLPPPVQNFRLKLEALSMTTTLNRVAGVRHARFSPHPTKPRVWLSTQSFPVTVPPPQVLETHFDRKLALLVGPHAVSCAFPTHLGALKFPEEFPIIMTFFHMSALVRYNPEFLARVVDSKYWPLLATARRHCLYKFLLLFWSAFNKQNTIINPD